MSNISFIGLFIAVLLMVFFMLQVGLFIRAINKKTLSSSLSAYDGKGCYDLMSLSLNSLNSVLRLLAIISN